ncbi:MAG: efflux transporter outer membrane subunit [Acidobacteria bacterium]|nr:efflux transporter outer membrane subunit [Acidobacteriota bacterium]
MRTSFTQISKVSCFLAVLSFVSFHPGCKPVGPDYKKPSIVPPPAWNAKMSEGMRAAEVLDDSLAQWWSALQDPTLQNLIERAMKGNLDLRRADAVVREARARRGIADADRFPTVTASGITGFQRGSDRMGKAANVGLFSAGFDAGWEIDVFGRVRRSIEAADAGLEAAQELLRDTLVSLLAEVAINYVEVRQYQAQLAIAEKNLKVQEDSYRLAGDRFAAGLTTRLDVDQAHYSVADTRSRIPALRIRLEQAKNRLAVLLGENPGGLSETLKGEGKIPVGPAEIAVGVPAETLRRRPDVRRAERLLAARTAAVGVATAAKYPRFSLEGTIGYEMITKGNPLSLGNIVGSLGATALYTVFDARRIRQNIEVQNALQEQALVDYESAILVALEEVENALIAYADEQVRRRFLMEASEAAGKALELVRTNYSAGLVDFQPVLESQRSLLSFQDQLAQSDAAVTSNLIRLYKALGGGWTAVPPKPVP